MARQTTVRLTDDLDGSDAQTTMRFTWEGIAYEIDLTSEHAEQFSAAVRPYLEAARRVGPARRRSRSGETTGSRVRPGRSVGEQAAIRDWARNHGFQLADRGRIPRHVLDAYQDAQQSDAPSASAGSAPTASQTRPAPARKTTGTKRAAAKTARSGKTAKSASARKAAGKKAIAKKTIAKNTSPRKTAAKKAIAKKMWARKTVAKKPAAKKATGAKKATRRAGRRRAAVATS